MNSKILRLVGLIVIISPLSIFYSIYLTTYLNTPVVQMAYVSWGDDPMAEVYIGWETPELTAGTVKYGEDPAALTNSAQELEKAQIHNLYLTGLDPDTKYYYEVIINEQVYARGQFSTAPSSIKPFSFGLFSDTQQKLGPGWHSRLASILDQKAYAFVGVVGDFVEEGVKAEWNDFFNRGKHYLDTIPIVPVQGNHDRPRDLDGDGTDEYYFNTYFSQSEDAVENTNEYDTFQQFYFSFNWSNVHFQILHFPQVDIDDTNEPNGLNPRDYYQAFTSDQLAWIEQDLQNAQSLPFRITMFHCPITGAGFYGPNFVLVEELLPILHQYNVTVTVHGHAHHFERGLLENPNEGFQDLTFYCVGTGGGLADVGLRPVEETIVCSASPSYTECYATEDQLEFTTFTFDGDIIDHYIISAGGNG